MASLFSYMKLKRLGVSLPTQNDPQFGAQNRFSASVPIMMSVF